MRRAVPLLRSDFEFQSTGNQCHTYGFDMWLPYHSQGNRDIDPYAFRSNMSPVMGFVWDVRRKDLDYKLARKLVGQWRKLAPNYLGDFYPLTHFTAATDAWMAWQFDRPDLGQGMVQVFRRDDSIYEKASLPLRGLIPDADYRVTDIDRSRPKTMRGRDLMEAGLPVTVADRPGAVIYTYERVHN
jgi:alpha-galactosidase